MSNHNEKIVEDKLCCAICPKDILHACERIYMDGHPPCASNFKSTDGEEIPKVTILKVIGILRHKGKAFCPEEESAFNYYLDDIEKTI